jgi:hypothetical protein
MIRKTAPRLLAAVGLAAILFWVNAYVCREMFSSGPVHTNSMQGFWIAMAQKGRGWFWPHWWPYWDCGMPFEFVYAPLIPGLTALAAWVRRIPAEIAFQSVSALFFCLGPVTMFLLVWRITRSQGCGFGGALWYSLAAPTKLFLPDENFAWKHFWDARRFYLMAVWDETPHLTALALLPLVILALWLAMERRRPVYFAGAAAAIAAIALASDFGPVLVVLSMICLLFTVGRDHLAPNAALAIGAGAYGYAIACPFLSPANLFAIAISSGQGGHGWTLSSLTAFGLFVFGWAVLWACLRRWTTDRWLQFVSLFAYATTAIPLLETYLFRHFLPQPNRYRAESEFALALLMAFAGRAIYRRMPRSVWVGLVLFLAGLGAEQIVSHRKFAKLAIPAADARTTVEHRTATWAEANLAGARLMLPGSLGKWADVFTGVTQFGGGSWSTVYNGTEQIGADAVSAGGATPEEDARTSLLWLRAYGAGAVAIPGPNSTEVWRDIRHPAKFEGVLPRVWREDDVSLYTTGIHSLAHAVDEGVLVKRPPLGSSDTTQIERYVAAFGTNSRPPAEVRWTGSDCLSIALDTAPAEVVSIQITHYPGWKATANGVPRPLYRDGLGLMWLRPNCAGACRIELAYDGGFELRACRVVSYAAIFGGPLLLLLRRRRRVR